MESEAPRASFFLMARRQHGHRDRLADRSPAIPGNLRAGAGRKIPPLAESRWPDRNRHSTGRGSRRQCRCLGDLLQTTLQLGDRNTDRSLHMSRGIFFLWPHVDHDHGASAQSSQQLIPRHRLEAVAIAIVLLNDAFELGEVTLADSPESPYKVYDFRPRQRIDDVRPCLARHD